MLIVTLVKINHIGAMTMTILLDAMTILYDNEYIF